MSCPEPAPKRRRISSPVDGYNDYFMTNSSPGLGNQDLVQSFDSMTSQRPNSSLDGGSVPQVTSMNMDGGDRHHLQHNGSESSDIQQLRLLRDLQRRSRRFLPNRGNNNTTQETTESVEPPEQQDVDTEIEITGSRSRPNVSNTMRQNAIPVQDLHLPRNYFSSTVRPGERPFHTPVVDLTQENDDEQEDVEFMSSTPVNDGFFGTLDGSQLFGITPEAFDAAESRLYTARVFQYLFRQSGMASLRSTRVRARPGEATDPSTPPRLQPDLRSKVLPPVKPPDDGFVRTWASSQQDEGKSYSLVCTKCQDELGARGAERHLNDESEEPNDTIQESKHDNNESTGEDEKKLSEPPYTGVFAASCSHVYCGKCAREYQKRPGRGKRAWECCAENCHIYLGGKLCMTEVFI